MRGCWILCSRGARGVGGTGGECEGGDGDGGVCVCVCVQLFGCWNSGAQLRLGAKEIYWTPVGERRHRGAIWQKKVYLKKFLGAFRLKFSYAYTFYTVFCESSTWGTYPSQTS